MKKSSSGYTLLEVLIGMTILIIGASALWHYYQAAVRVNMRTQTRQDALNLAGNDIELARMLPRLSVNDTTYTGSGIRGKTYTIKRTVLDSSKIFDIMDEVDIDETGSPLYLRRPLEVRVDVYEKDDDDEFYEDSDKKPLASLIFLKPQYQWQ